MCETTNVNSSSFLVKGELKYPRGIDEKISIAENKLNSAQQSFTDHVIEITAFINSRRLKLGQLGKHAPQFQKGAANCLEENKTGTLHKYDRTELEIEKLQNKLHENVFHSSLSIKRSLMKLSNLLAQHHLLNLPYYELKAYSNQIVSHQKSNECVNSRPASERLSYSEALQNLEQIFGDVESVEKKTLCLIEENQSSKHIIDDPHNISNDEYKCLPQFPTC